MAMSKVVRKGGRGNLHMAASPGGASLCGIPTGQTQKAAGPALLKQMCAACKSKAAK